MKAIVVAQYMEDLEWTKDIPSDFKIIVYNKSDPNHKNYLPNIGREAHTYIHHIITNYNYIDDITVFVQGDLYKHTERSYFLKKLGMMNNKISYCAFGVGGINVLKDEINAAFRAVFGKDCPGNYTTKSAALLGVSKSRILSHPKEFYERLMQQLCSDVINAQDLERLWELIFNKKEHLEAWLKHA